jgi:hypothetical protein
MASSFGVSPSMVARGLPTECVVSSWPRGQQFPVAKIDAGCESVERFRYGQLVCGIADGALLLGMVIVHVELLEDPVFQS